MSTQAIAAWPQDVEVRVVDDTDPALVKRAQKGDTEAFSELVRRHQHVVYNLAYRFMRDLVLSEDMAQEAFLKGFRLLKGFRGDCSFSSWMYRVTSSVCLTELHRRKRRGEVQLHPSHVGTIDAQTDSLDMPELIRGCVTQLPDNYATIITMYYLKEISYDEIAEAMNIPIGTLKTWMFRARKKLRKIVEKELAHEA